jgi:hypothetical protein
MAPSLTIMSKRSIDNSVLRAQVFVFVISHMAPSLTIMSNRSIDNSVLRAEVFVFVICGAGVKRHADSLDHLQDNNNCDQWVS